MPPCTLVSPPDADEEEYSAWRKNVLVSDNNLAQAANASNSSLLSKQSKSLQSLSKVSLDSGM